MSKELEALYKLGEIEFETGDYMNDDGYMMSVKNTEIYEILEKALTPPTAEEVCEELNKWYSDVVDYVFIHGVDDFTYDEKNKRFYKRMLNSPHEMTICRIDTNGCMELREPLPPHLITLIGRFYEGVEEVGE